MPGVLRPYTLTDVLASVNGASGDASAVDTAETSTGVFGEADETATLADTVTTTVAVNSAWDNGVWGAFSWG